MAQGIGQEISAFSLSDNFRASQLAGIIRIPVKDKADEEKRLTDIIAELSDAIENLNKRLKRIEEMINNG